MTTYRIICAMVILFSLLLFYLNMERPVRKYLFKKLEKESARCRTMRKLQKGEFPNLLGFVLSQQEYDSVKHLFTPEQRQKLKKRIRPTNLT